MLVATVGSAQVSRGFQTGIERAGFVLDQDTSRLILQAVPLPPGDSCRYCAPEFADWNFGRTHKTNVVIRYLYASAEAFGARWNYTAPEEKHIIASWRQAVPDCERAGD